MFTRSAVQRQIAFTVNHKCENKDPKRYKCATPTSEGFSYIVGCAPLPIALLGCLLHQTIVPRAMLLIVVLRIEQVRLKKQHIQPRIVYPAIA